MSYSVDTPISMTPRPFNRKAKVKRVRSLVMTVLLSIAAPLAISLTDLVANGAPEYGWLGALAQSDSFLLMGVGLVTSSLYNELMKKQKSSWEKEVLGKLSMLYIFVGVASFFILQSFSPDTVYEVYRTALFILLTYEFGVGISVFSILAGKS